MCTQRRLSSAWASAQSDQSSLSAWRQLRSLATLKADSEDSDQSGFMPRLIWVFAGRTCHKMAHIVVCVWNRKWDMKFQLECNMSTQRNRVFDILKKGDWRVLKMYVEDILVVDRRYLSYHLIKVNLKVLTLNDLSLYSQCTNLKLWISQSMATLKLWISQIFDPKLLFSYVSVLLIKVCFVDFKKYISTHEHHW